MAARDGAKRRTDPRLRSFMRHVPLSIAMALASALHHSVDKTHRAKHDAPQGPEDF